MKVVKLIGHIGLALGLTILTQIGGLIYLLALLIAKRWSINLKGKVIFIFVVLYSIATFLIVPYIAPIFGRECVQHSAQLQPTNWMTVLLNRNYVTPEMNVMLKNTEKSLQNIGQKVHISYLDACFPFIDGFPLLPHLSHSDGNKIDVSLIYENDEGELSDLKPSRSGYGVFVDPLPNEYNQTEVCKAAGYFQYDFPKYLSLGRINSHLRFSEKGTGMLLRAILEQPSLQKVFIEPHLKTRLGASHPKIRFHGCGAVRHDDHIHLQI